MHAKSAQILTNNISRCYFVTFLQFLTYFIGIVMKRDQTTDKNQTKVTSYVSYLRLNPNHKDLKNDVT